MYEAEKIIETQVQVNKFSDDEILRLKLFGNGNKKPIYAHTCTCEQNECVRSESKQYERKTFGLHQFKIQFIKYFSRSFVGCIALYDACLVSVKIVFALSLTSDLYLKLNLYLLAFHMFQHLGIFPFRCLLYQPINNLSMCAKRAGNSCMRT